MYISVVIPCYNESEVFGETLQRVKSVCEETHGNYEIIFVDDGSTDDTWDQIQASSEIDAQVRGIKLARNFGHQKALSAGLEAACGERILMLDADLQDPPELLPDMLAMMDRGYDIVYGLRKSREGESGFKKASAKLFYKLLNQLSDVEMPVDSGDFRLVNRQALNSFLLMREQDRYVRGMFAWLGHRQIGLEYVRKARAAGDTKYSLGMMMRLAIDGLTGFSVSPLRVASKMAIISLLLSGVLAVYVIASWVYLDSVPGWASLLLAISFFSGMQLLTLGIMGEYIGRIFVEIKGRPLYLVEKKTPDENAE